MDVPSERYDTDHGGVTWLWRCACGWTGVVTESGIVSRAGVRRAIDRALGHDGDE